MDNNIRIINPPSKTALDANDYLYHHGIKNQKHGKRNASHYPLNQEDFSAEELAAGAKESVWAQESDEGQPKPKVVQSKLSKEEKAKYSGNPNQNVINKSKRMAEQKAAKENKAETNSSGETSKNNLPSLIKNKAYYSKVKSGSLSDDELREAINRIRVEDDYNKLTNQVTKPKEDSFAKQMVKKFARQTVESFVNSASSKIGPALVSKLLDEEGKKAEKEASKEKAMKSIVDKKKKAAKGDSQKFVESLSSKELDWLSKRYNNQENAAKAAGFKKDDSEWNTKAMQFYTTKSKKRRNQIVNDFWKAGKLSELTKSSDNAKKLGIRPSETYNAPGEEPILNIMKDDYAFKTSKGNANVKSLKKRFGR